MSILFQYFLEFLLTFSSLCDIMYIYTIKCEFHKRKVIYMINKNIVIEKFEVIEFNDHTRIITHPADITNILNLLPLSLKALLLSIKTTEKGLAIFKLSCHKEQFETLIGIRNNADFPKATSFAVA